MKISVNHRKSWERATWYTLPDGWEAITNWNQFYGEIVTQFHHNGELVWQACNGTQDPLPDFAKAWVDRISNGHGWHADLVRIPSRNQWEKQSS